MIWWQAIILGFSAGLTGVAAYNITRYFRDK